MTHSVLLVDDYASLRNLYRLALHASGQFQVAAEASDGLEGIAAARRAQPDLVLLDLSMPNLDGLEALVRIREASPRSRVVVLSGFTRDKMEPIALELGATAYIEKGIRPKDLVERLLDAAVSEPKPLAAMDDAMAARVRELV